MIVGYKPRKTASSMKASRRAFQEKMRELVEAETEKRKQRHEAYLADVAEKDKQRKIGESNDTDNSEV